MQEDTDFRKVAGLLVAVADRIVVTDDQDASGDQSIRDWIYQLADSELDLKSFLAEKIERAFRF